MQIMATSMAAGTPAPRNQETDQRPVPTEEFRAPDAKYISPHLRYDYGIGVLVMEFRNLETGEVNNQIPSKKALADYARRAAASAEDAKPADESMASSASETASAPQGASVPQETAVAAPEGAAPQGEGSAPTFGSVYT